MNCARLVMCCFFLADMVCHAKAELSLAVGPGWVFGESILRPSQPIPGQGFLAVANEETAWNMLPLLRAKGVYVFNEFVAVSISLGGGWLRFGQAALFSGVQGPVIDFSRDLVRVRVSANSMGFDAGAKFTIPIWCALESHILMGYNVSLVAQNLAFLQSPTVFFVRSLNTSPYVGVELGTEVCDVEFEVEYKFLMGSMNIRLAQNDSDERVLRSLRMFSNEFSLSIAYHVTEHISVTQNITYEEGLNNGFGTSRVYNGATLLSVSRNVARLQEKKFSLTTSLAYDF